MARHMRAGPDWDEGWRLYVKFLATIGFQAVAALAVMVVAIIFLYAIACVLDVSMAALIEIN